jgi:2-polyprenyl-6-methoxyphenol hydroxylase-like FAD-dependent oxidoreductase
MSTIGTALVAGGGVAGPVVALALRKAGIVPTVFEAYASPADGVGGTLAIAPNGIDALRVVGAEDAVRAVGLPLTRTVVADRCGRRLGEFPALRGLPPSLAVWRSELQRALHERAVAAGAEFVFDRRLVGTDESDRGITARFADGSTATGDLLVGADGIRSTVRGLIDPSAPGPRHVPLLNFVGVAATAPAELADASYFVFGRRAFLGYWSQPDGTTAWFANVPSAEPMTAAQAQRRPADDWLAHLRDIYADDTPGRELLAHTDAGDVACLGSLEIMPTVPRWHRGRMVLVGDAVHAPSPSSGQGASLAAESAVELARCLRDCPDLASALSTYEGLRRRRVEKVAARAVKTNNAKAFGPFAVAMMRLMMPLAMRTFLTPERTLGPEQRHRIEWDRPVVAAAR